jgi:hypothetical protein
MGLTISYTLSTKCELSDAVVQELAGRAAKFARKIGCAEVHGPMPGGPDLCKLRKLPNGDTTGDFIEAKSGWSVTVVPGDGSEPAHFGLCRYPDMRHWTLTSFCKTQYAGQHGIEHFLACHRRIISLLDLWRDFGVDVKVMDEGEFWETRSLERLRQRLATYDRLVAAVAGTLMDDLGKGEAGVQAEIFDNARFERLEAEGRAEFASQLAALRQLLADGGAGLNPLSRTPPK